MELGLGGFSVQNREAFEELGVRWSSVAWTCHSSADANREATEVAGEMGVNLIGQLINPRRAGGRPPAGYRWELGVRDIVGANREIKYWELCPEPSCPINWGGVPSPKAYVEDFLRPGYLMAKGANPEAQVLVGGVHREVNTEFIERLYAAGGREWFDVMNLHPFTYLTDNWTEHYREGFSELGKIMGRWGDEGKPVWTTEIGKATGEHHTRVLDSGEEVVVPGVTEMEQAQFLRDFVQICEEFQFGVALWAMLDDVPGENWTCHIGLRRADGTAKPVYDAFVAMLRE